MDINTIVDQLMEEDDWDLSDVEVGSNYKKKVTALIEVPLNDGATGIFKYLESDDFLEQLFQAMDNENDDDYPRPQFKVNGFADYGVIEVDFLSQSEATTEGLKVLTDINRENFPLQSI